MGPWTFGAQSTSWRLVLKGVLFKGRAPSTARRRKAAVASPRLGASEQASGAFERGGRHALQPSSYERASGTGACTLLLLLIWAFGRSIRCRRLSSSVAFGFPLRRRLGPCVCRLGLRPRHACFCLYTHKFTNRTRLSIGVVSLIRPHWISCFVESASVSTYM